jgi:hypothetical protein
LAISTSPNLSRQAPSKAVPIAYAAAVRREAQALRYRAHDKIMRAFLEDEIYEGRLRVEAGGRTNRAQQMLLAE